ncbi:40401_t:CDS:2 [Gigaspora margarita]|uniref:40401_t:CDS:1 n=1 Tax=Gigaspora margarita TaxID=4874 RepID=A0ABM8W2M2_GIGMA|nr:40401_t:CDS:2 [Gigaspora margarita]
MKIKDFFVKLTTRELSPECNIDIIDPETIDSAEISKIQDTTTTQVSPNCNIIEVTTSVGIYVHYQLKTDKVHHGGEWSTQLYADMQGKQFVNCLTETIWYIDMHNHKRFKDCSYHIPKLFLEFFALAPYATSSWILKENFNWLRDELDNFIVAISNYAEFLQCQREITTANHASETPIRTVDQSTTIQIHKQNFWVTPIDKSKYYNLEQLITDLPLWKPVDLEEFLPTDPVQRMRYIQGLSHAFSFKIREYRFSTENNVFNAISIWKIDKEANEEKIL